MKNCSFLPDSCARPAAKATVRGSEAYSGIWGEVKFYPHQGAVLVQATVSGLPENTARCQSPLFGFHIHEGTSCTGNASDAFADAGAHENPDQCPHPYHAGDMPPLFGVHGRAYMAFLTDRITLPEILGKTVIIHAHPDDFCTQPSGNSGEKIACGVISACR